MAKATIHFRTDVEVRRHGYQMGLETPVVHADNDECWVVALVLVVCFNRRYIEAVSALTREHSAWVVSSQG